MVRTKPRLTRWLRQAFLIRDEVLLGEIKEDEDWPVDRDAVRGSDGRLSESPWR